MVVCLCTGSTEQDIQRALEAGAASLAEIGDSCRAGLDCSGCHSALLAILHRRPCEGCPNGNGRESISSAAMTGRSESSSERSPA